MKILRTALSALAILAGAGAAHAQPQPLPPDPQPPPPGADPAAQPPAAQPAPPPADAQAQMQAPPPEPFQAAPAVEEPEAPPMWARSQTNRIGGEIDFWSAKTSLGGGLGDPIEFSIIGLGLTAVAQLRVVENVYVVAELPFGYANVSVDVPEGVTVENDSIGTFTIGNPTVGAYYGTVLEQQFAIFVGGTLSAPTIFYEDPSPTGDDEDDDRQATVGVVGLMRAGYDLHRWAPESLPVRLFGGVEISIIPNLYYRGDLAPTVYVPLDEQDVEVFLEQGNEIEGRADMGLGGGLRIQEAFFLTATDKIQTAAELFGTYEPPEAGLYARLGFLLALDESGQIGGGFGFDEGKLAMVRLALGGKW